MGQVTVEDVAAAVREYFEAVGRASMELPDGWFGGRPFENHHALTRIETTGTEVVIELDGLQRITVVGPATALCDDAGLRISSFDRLHLEARSYTDGTPLYDRSYDDGALNFRTP